MSARRTTVKPDQADRRLVEECTELAPLTAYVNAELVAWLQESMTPTERDLWVGRALRVHFDRFFVTGFRNVSPEQRRLNVLKRWQKETRPPQKETQAMARILVSNEAAAVWPTIGATPSARHAALAARLDEQKETPSIGHATRMISVPKPLAERIRAVAAVLESDMQSVASACILSAKK